MLEVSRQHEEGFDQNLLQLENIQEMSKELGQLLQSKCVLISRYIWCNKELT
jgi:hypothetical protein